MQHTSGVNVNFRCDRGIVDIDVLDSFPSSSVFIVYQSSFRERRLGNRGQLF